MVDFSKPLTADDFTGARKFVERLQAMRPAGHKLARSVREDIAVARAEVERFRQQEQLTPAELEAAKKWLAEWCEAAAANLEHVANMLDTLFGKQEGYSPQREPD